MIQRVVILTFFNQYESKRYFSLCLKNSFSKLGIKTLLIDPVRGQITRELDEQIQAFVPDMTLSFNTMLPNNQGKFLWDYSEIPHLTLLVDPAIYSLSLMASPYSLFSTVDKADVDWMETKGKDCFFLPHATEESLWKDPEENRDLEIIFLGTCTDYETILDNGLKNCSDLEIKVLKYAMDRIFSPPLLSMLECINEGVSHFQINQETIDIPKIFFLLDQYTRGKDRIELIRAIKTIPVHIFGENSWNNEERGSIWKKYLGDQSNVILHDSVSYGEGLKLIQRAKISLNSSPFFKSGSHERILNSMACGTVSLTNQNGFTDDFFNSEEVLTYVPGDWKNIEEKIEPFLQPYSRTKIAESAYKKIVSYHTWDIRAKQLLQAMENILNNSKGNGKTR